MKLLWITSHPSQVSNAVREALGGWALHFEPNYSAALALLRGQHFDAVVAQTGTPDLSEAEILENIWRADGSVPLIVHNRWGSYDDALRLTRAGCCYVLLGELEPAGTARALEEAQRWALSPVAADPLAPWRRFLIGESPAMLEICALVELVANKRCTVLITGETGTGKEMLARALHAAGARSSHPMVAVNCTALPANLIEAELFGHAKGAFTGAYTGRLGRFEQAHRGTIFLDEIGDLPMEAQAKLLRVLQEQEFERLGSSETVRVDVRVMAATNLDLESAARERKFREDLFYRLNVVPIQMPALRHRPGDIPLLLDHFLEKIGTAENSAVKKITPEAVDYLLNLEWPGNVRQLEHTVQMAVALSGDRRLLYPADFHSRRKQTIAAGVLPGEKGLPIVTNDGLDFDSAVSDFERSLLNQALTLARGNKAKAADLLRIKRTTLLAKLKTLHEMGQPVASPRPQLVAKRTSAVVFEPNDSVRQFIARSLQKRNCQVLEARTMSAARELAGCWSGNIALLVTPREESVDSFADVAPSLGRIVLTEREDLTECPSRARTLYLTRPFSSEDLLRAFDELSASERGIVHSICA